MIENRYQTNQWRSSRKWVMLVQFSGLCSDFLFLQNTFLNPPQNLMVLTRKPPDFSCGAAEPQNCLIRAWNMRSDARRVCAQISGEVIRRR